MKSFEFATIGEYFRQQRETSGSSQKELAEELGYSSPQMVSNWERGLCSPPLDAIAQMIQLFGLSKNEVMNLILTENKKFLDKKLNLYRRAASKRA